LTYVLEKTFGPVCHASIDVDADLKYPKGAARVTFHTHKSYVAAMTGRFFNIPNNNGMKRVSHGGSREENLANG
jgi:cytoplasmic polyadenylation element-binding protein